MNGFLLTIYMLLVLSLELYTSIFHQRIIKCHHNVEARGGIRGGSSFYKMVSSIAVDEIFCCYCFYVYLFLLTIMT